MKNLYKKADAIVSISQEIKNDLIGNFYIPSQRIEVIYNPFKIGEIINLSQESLDKEYEEIFECPVIITSGRLVKEKGQWHLIRAFKIVKEQIPNAKLVILGEGELNLYLKEISYKMGLKNDVFFLGWQKNPFRFISKAKVFVLSSLCEGFPMVLVEAMVCKCPVVSTNCKSGPKEILNNGKYGFLIHPFSGNFIKYDESFLEQEKMMAKSILNLIKDRHLSNNLRDKSFCIVQKLDIANIGKKYLNLINKKFGVRKK